MNEQIGAVGAHMYVDESTAADYLVVCAVVASSDVTASRAAMRALLLPSQRGVHMKNERNRAARILSTIVDLKPRVLIYRVARQTPPMQARRLCVQELAKQACRIGVSRVVLDTIDSVVERDRSWLISGARSAGHVTPAFSYHHQRRHEEPLLWIADATGWAWARGGGTKKLVKTIVTVIDLLQARSPTPRSSGRVPGPLLGG